jgi:hypothetical protein
MALAFGKSKRLWRKAVKNKVLRFGEMALQLGYITEAQLEEGLRVQRERVERGEDHMLLGLVLLRLGYVETGHLIEILRAHSGVTGGAQPV